MTAIETETVTVTFDEFKEKLQHYMELQETKRLVVMHGEEEIAVLGPWLPEEERFLSPQWFFDELVPPEPINPEDPYSLSRALEETREDRTFT
jgi:hypothetical protein